MESGGLLRDAKLIDNAKEADGMENIIMYKGKEAAVLRSQNVWRLSPIASLLGALVGVAQALETLLLPLKLWGS